MSQQRIGRYQVLEDIATGGQGAVYKATDPLLGRIVAIKVLKPELTSDSGYLERFSREAAIAAGIDHPNVVKIFDMGEDDGSNFIVMCDLGKPCFYTDTNHPPGMSDMEQARGP